MDVFTTDDDVKAFAKADAVENDARVCFEFIGKCKESEGSGRRYGSVAVLHHEDT
jgi:hypothetical protein